MVTDGKCFINGNMYEGHSTIYGNWIGGYCRVNGKWTCFADWKVSFKVTNETIAEFAKDREKDFENAE